MYRESNVRVEDFGYEETALEYSGSKDLLLK
jgi:hypothetical protein